MKENRILFVEGVDDLHTIWAICEHFKIEETFVVEIPDRTGKINKKAKQSELGGIDNVFKATDAYLIDGSSAVERLGIVIDADENKKSRWQKVADILEKAGYEKENIPDSPDSNGTIISQEFLPTFGVWIMPDNVLERGMLEDFLEYLVPNKDENPVWQKAVDCSNEVLKMKEETFSEIHLSKAQIHAFLAWQKDCGKPFGQAITSKYLDVNNPQCQNFVNWLNRLFVD